MSLKDFNGITLILASQSRRRKKLLSSLGIKFKSISPRINEQPKNSESPLEFARRTAEEKSMWASQMFSNRIILSADTIVVLDDKILGKPKNKKEAVQMLKRLSNKTHTVITAICVLNQKRNKKLIDHEITEVTFRKLTQNEIRDYVSKGTCLDKAGSYGIQEDFGAVFVKSINGCYYNVVGLPLSKTYQMLMKVL